jgi:CP family cyanate transporter-like MFS transporter
MTLLAAGLLLIALNLRIGVASVGPVLDSIERDLSMSSSVAGLLTSIPVVAFGAFAFLTPHLTRAVGLHRLLGLTMLVVAVGLVLRMQPNLASLFAGTTVVGAAIAIANVLIPAAINHDFRAYASVMMGVYSTALFCGAGLASGLTVPLERLTSQPWPRALALWAIPATIAFLAWLPQTLRSPGHHAARNALADPSDHAEPLFRALLTDRVALAVTALMGLQSAGYYAMLTWIPSLLEDHGMSPQQAGWMLSYSAFPGILASLVTPALAKRCRPTWVPVAASALLSGLGYFGLAFAPLSTAYASMSALGLGQGAGLSFALCCIVWRSPDSRHTEHVSTMVQGFGYMFAALGPVAVGVLRTSTGGWNVPLSALGVLLVAQMHVGAVASRDRHVLGSPRAQSTGRVVP